VALLVIVLVGTGLARAGSTILLEWLGRHPDCATHRYKDYPLVHIPYWWNAFLSRTPQRSAGPAERAHADRILITPESPEAFEEVLWMSFFPGLHSPEHSNVIDGGIRHPHFESFYRDHIRKLLLVRGGRRYLSKANYHVTRLEYLQLLFTDARFVIPVREPVWHIASLMKQHRLFCEQEAANVKALAHMQRVGHYEFGLDRRPINPGDDARTAEIRELREPVGLRTDRLRRWENGSVSRSFSSNSDGYSPQTIEKPFSLSHLARDDRLNPQAPGPAISPISYCDEHR
jgi:hypothetical protein